MRSWPTMPMPFPNVQRSPIVMIGSPRSSACTGMPALSEASGPIDVRAPISMRPSPKMTLGGNEIMLPSPNAWKRRAARWFGPIAP